MSTVSKSKRQRYFWWFFEVCSQWAGRPELFELNKHADIIIFYPYFYSKNYSERSQQLEQDGKESQKK